MADVLLLPPVATESVVRSAARPNPADTDILGVADLPPFRYHPDPLSTGSVEAAPDDCSVCGEARGFVYRGPADGLGNPEPICPWCIADGTAADRFDLEFTDVGIGVPPDVPRAVIDIVARRTPGFSGWQQEHWLYHCQDATAFLGPAGRREVEAHAGAVLALNAEGESYGWSASEVADYIAALSKDASPTAYLFRCLRCATYLAYSEFD